MNREAHPLELALLALLLVAEALAVLVAALLELERCGVARPPSASRAAAQALANERGFNPPHRPSEKSDNVTLNETGKGTSAAYLAARLKKAGRDDLLDQIAPMTQLLEAVKGKPGGNGSNQHTKSNAPHRGALTDPTIGDHRQPKDRKSRLIRTLTNLASVTV